MSASIDGNEFSGWDGYIRNALPRSNPYEQAGVGGYGITFDARDPRIQTITTWTRGDATIASTIALENTYRLLEKTAVTVIDPLGREFDNVVILSSDSMFRKDSISQYIVTEWRIIIDAIDPA